MAKKKDESIMGVIKPMAIEKMVAAPIIAAVKAQSMMNDEMIEFLDKVALDKNGDVRMIPFAFESDEVDEEGRSTGKQHKISVDLPYMALVQPPALAIENVEVAFDLRIHTSSNQKEVEYIKGARGKKIKIEREKMNIETSLTHQSSNSRKSDTSAKYSFKLTAKKQEKPESLSRIVDILTESSLIPRSASKTKVDPGAETDTDTEDDITDETDTTVDNETTVEAEDSTETDTTAEDDTVVEDDESTGEEDTTAEDDTVVEDDESTGEEDTTAEDDTVVEDDESTEEDDTTAEDDTVVEEDDTVVEEDDTVVEEDDTVVEDDESTGEEDTTAEDDTGVEDDESTEGEDTTTEDDTTNDT